MDHVANLRKHFEVGIELRKRMAETLAPEVARAGLALAAAIRKGNKALACGNGGSAADSQHFAAEMVGRFERERPGMPAIALTTDTSNLTAIANDYGYDYVFSKGVEALGNAGDVLLAISTSGNSRNVVEALAEARRRGLVTVALVGYDGGRVADEALADHVIVTRSEHIPRIQEAQASAYHVLRGLVEPSGTGGRQ